MQLLAILGLGVSSNLDTIGVGIAYGCKKIRLPFISNFICALIPSIGTYIMILLGEVVRSTVSMKAANMTGAGILIATGVLMIIQSFRRRSQATKLKKGASPYWKDICSELPANRDVQHLGRILENPAQVDYDYSGSIDIKEASVLATALTLNNLSCGLAAGLVGLNIILTPVVACVISLIFFAAGIKIGRYYMSGWTGEKSDIAAGLL